MAGESYEIFWLTMPKKTLKSINLETKDSIKCKQFQNMFEKSSFFQDLGQLVWKLKSVTSFKFARNIFLASMQHFC